MTPVAVATLAYAAGAYDKKPCTPIPTSPFVLQNMDIQLKFVSFFHTEMA